MGPEQKRAGSLIRTTVIDAIRDLVIHGEYRPGDRLVERQLAERLGVSRIPVREALRQLAHEGLAEERPTRGMVVRRLDEDDIDELFEVRAALEAVLCRRVVAHATDPGLERLDEIVTHADNALAASDTRLAVQWNAAFHECLVELADSPVLAAVMAPVAGRMRWLLSQHEDPATMNADHALIARALRQRDLPTTMRLCRQHLAASQAAVASTRRTSR
jgi:DNA-binding GntR family transcriptional regulator